MEVAWPDDALSLRRVQTVCKELAEERRLSFSRVEVSGRALSDTRKEVVDQIKDFVEEDNNVSTRFIAEKFSHNSNNGSKYIDSRFEEKMGSNKMGATYIDRSQQDYAQRETKGFA